MANVIIEQAPQKGDTLIVGFDKENKKIIVKIKKKEL